MTTPIILDPIQLSGSRTGDEPDWTDDRVESWVRGFLVLGIVMRLIRFGLVYPLWRDEAYVFSNLLDRDFLGLMKPLDYQQVCPLLFLWAEKAIGMVLGFSEWSLRLLPTIASIASLILLRHVAGRLLKGVALVIAVGILAIGYTPIRHGGEIKPYATDFLMALGLITLAVEWLRRPECIGFLWGLAALGPLAIGISNPSIFVAVSVGLVLAIPVLRTRSARKIVPLIVFGIASSITFIVLLRWINASQSASVMEWMRVYWAGAFPPHSFVPMMVWLVRVHTSQMFAYPAGGDLGASTLTTAFFVVAIIAYVRRGPRSILALMLIPFALGLIAAFLGRYPYGGSGSTMQYVAPAIILMAGLGAAVLLSRVPGPSWRRRSPGLIMHGLLAIGLAMIAWDMTHPYKIPLDQFARDFARRFWAEESRDAEILCARTDLQLSLNTLKWQSDRAALYLCHQAIYSERHRVKAQPRLDRVSDSHPLRIVVFGEVSSDQDMLARWIEAHADRYRLRSKRERVLNKGIIRGKASEEDRYVVYELVPTSLASADESRSRR